MLIDIRLSKYFFTKLKRTQLGCYNSHHLGHCLTYNGYKIKEWIYQGKTMKTHEDWIEMNKEYEYFGGHGMFGIADNLEQVFELFKQPINDSNRKFVIEFYERDSSFWDNDKWDKSGSYIGTQETEREEYSGNVVLFHILEILKAPGILTHIKNYITYPFTCLRFHHHYRKIKKK